MKQKEPLTYSVPDAGRLLGIGRDTAYAAVHDGSLPALRFGKRLVVSKFTLERLLQGEPLPPAGGSDDEQAA